MRKFVKDLITEGDFIDSIFLVKKILQRNKKDGGTFLNLELADKTGSINCFMWDNFQDLDLANLKFVQVQGIVTNYNGKMQLTIKTMETVTESSIELSDFFNETTKDIEAMFSDIKQKVNSIANPFLKTLLINILNDPEISKLLKKAPAAKSLHNAFIGGLLEHIYDMLKLADFLVGYYGDINKDLLFAGVILHDLGKIKELSFDDNYQYSDEGRLLGHNIIGIEILDSFVAKIKDFPKKILVQLKHLILSHHGRPEWGASKLPMTLEAVILHYIDNIDSKIQGFKQFIANDKSLDKNWTERSFMFDNIELFKGNIDND